jgi:hypothetical protein
MRSNRTPAIAGHRRASYRAIPRHPFFRRGMSGRNEASRMPQQRCNTAHHRRGPACSREWSWCLARSCFFLFRFGSVSSRNCALLSACYRTGRLVRVRPTRCTVRADLRHVVYAGENALNCAQRNDPGDARGPEFRRCTGCRRPGRSVHERSPSGESRRSARTSRPDRLALSATATL